MVYSVKDAIDDAKDIITGKPVDKDKEIWVIWSGGQDSSAIVDALCKQNPTETIYLLSIEMEQALSNKADKESRTILSSIFKSRGYNIEMREMKLDGNYSSSGLGQLAAWATILSCVMMSRRAIYFGYIKEDDMWHTIDGVKKVIEGLKIIRNAPDCQVSIPLEWLSKADVVRYLNEEHLLEFCNTCDSNSQEAPYAPCGSCVSCRKFAKAKWELEQENYKLEPSEPSESDIIEPVKEV